jgi:Anti-sigma-K factor rskA
VTGPTFDELIGPEVEGAERERLRRIHELLVQSGPPPELAPELEAGPKFGMTLGRQRPRRYPRRLMLLAAAIAVLVGAFVAGYVSGNGGGTSATPSEQVLKLAGTSAAPQAFASLEIEPHDSAGNWPMKVSVTGLPRLPQRQYYEVWLVRHGQIFGSCGSFVVGGPNGTTSVYVNAPYRLKPGDSWVVTRWTPGSGNAGPVVLRPTV